MDKEEEKRVAARIGRRIANARLNADMTQQKLAELLGVGDEAVSRIERGAAMVSIPKLLDIAEALRQGADVLLLGASSRVDDQARLMGECISGLSATERDFIVEHVHRLAERLHASREALPP